MSSEKFSMISFTFTKPNSFIWLAYLKSQKALSDEHDMI
jgi:hypothetical protein